ncbi:MAG: transcriptional regulator NrdR [Solirubrobacterales bacterium]|nr:transcriptional regulator NrdR [Solirubrobacterales bacterium]
MLCPRCGHESSRVLESRSSEEGAAVRRRRQCAGCGNRFTTYERHEVRALFVRKRDGRLQPFDHDKLRGGLARASHKRPVEPEAIDDLVGRIEAEAVRSGGEITAARVGDLCLAGLKEIDQVAYLQFAAVYRQLGVEDVQAELDRLTPEPAGS